MRVPEPDDAMGRLIRLTPRSAVPQRGDLEPFGVGPLAGWMLAAIRRRGTLVVIVGLTVGAVTASLVLTVMAVGLIYGFSAEMMAPAMILGAAIPAIVAPATMSAIVRLASRLDAAGDSLKRAASTDPLTGLMNRRGFFDAFADFAAQGRAAHVSMIDVDAFKALNDRHGHPTGDAILQGVADWLQSLTGTHGFAARMGGDEFALVIPAEPSESLPVHQTMLMDGVAVSVTTGSVTTDEADDLDAALSRADELLYRNKRARTGRSM
ncbi:MAG: GGDEF domain-containing protein [Ilumatobacter sp.]